MVQYPSASRKKRYQNSVMYNPPTQTNKNVIVSITIIQKHKLDSSYFNYQARNNSISSPVKNKSYNSIFFLFHFQYFLSQLQSLLITLLINHHIGPNFISLLPLIFVPLPYITTKTKEEVGPIY